MKARKLKLLYNGRYIKQYFNGALNLNIYDFQTMNWYMKKNTNESTVEELETMLETLQDGFEKGNVIESLGLNVVNTVISLFAIIVALFLAMFIAVFSYLLNEGDGENVTYGVEMLQFFQNGVILAVVVYLLITVTWFIITIKSNIVNYKLQKVIKIIIALKNKNEM